MTYLIFIGLLSISFIICVIKRKFFTSFHDKCYEEMESQGNAVFGMCGGQMGGDYETEYLSYSCINCPYFNISILKKENKDD